MSVLRSGNLWFNVVVVFSLFFGGAYSVVANEKTDSVNRPGEVPTDATGKKLNLGLESGDLTDWVAEGEAFVGQPIKGDVVSARREDMASEHVGEYWVGSYEIEGDTSTGTLTSVSFPVRHPWASFLVGGGGSPDTFVEVVHSKSGKVISQAIGQSTENLKPVAVDLSLFVGQDIFIRLVDRGTGSWGHINFDDFRFHSLKPDYPLAFAKVDPDSYTHAGLTPEEAAKVMTVPEGFSVTAFAGEPDVMQPIAMALDDRGRVWVAEAYGYPVRLPEDQAKDRILIFEDKDGDGRFDTRKVFAEKLNLVSGLELGFGGVWVGSAPNLLFIPDKNGDDIPDGKPEIVLDGWGFEDTHETLNAFMWGPDGWLYGCHGVFTHSRVGKPGTSKEDRVPINAGVWRYHPTRQKFEVFAEGTSNPWGVDFNDRGQAFITACVIPHLYHLFPGGRYQRQAGGHFNRYSFDDIKTIAKHRHFVGDNPHRGNGRSDSAGGGHAHSGAMIYLGGLWPEKYRDQIFMNNIHGARLNQDMLAPSGSGYVGDRAPDFLMANDVWSQILYFTYGPDGNVYMIDWYDANQCHHKKVDGHDRENGRIFKITYGKNEAVDVDMQKLTSAELVKALENQNDWYPRHARRILQERGPNSELYPALDKLAFEHPDDTRRLRGLRALHAIGGLDDARLSRALKDESPYVRGWAIQLATEEGAPSDALADQFVALAESDPSPVVRLYLASAAPKLSSAKRFEMLKNLVAHTEDENDHNLPLMYWYAIEPLTQDMSVDVFALLQSTKIGLVRDFLARRLSQQDEGKFLPQLISATLSSPANVEVASAVIREILEGLRGERRVKMPDTWPAAYRALASSTDPQLVRLATQLAIKFADPQAIDLQRKALADANAPAEIRRDALSALVSARVPGLAPVLQSLVNHPDLAGPAIRALGGYEDPNTPTVLIESYAKLSFNDKRDALNTLASRPAYANALLDAVEQNRIARSDLAADLVRQLRSNKDKNVVDRVASVIGTVRNTPKDKQKQIARLKVLLTSRPAPENAPDASLGRAVFAKTCQQCHTLFGEGKKIGPDLTGSNRADLDYVLSNVVDPSALVGKDYQAHIVQTDDGRQFVGIVSELPGGALQITTANGVEVVPQQEIEARKVSESSMMPDDILRPLSEREVRSLVAYLASPAQVALPPVKAESTESNKVTFLRTQLDNKFRSEGVAVGDFNHDGKKDIAAGPVWFAAPDWKMSEVQNGKNEFDPRHYSHSFVNASADLNGDGWDDFIVVDFPGQQTWWFENPGESTGAWKQHMITRVSNNESPHVVNIDGDKKLALVMGVAPDPAKPDDARQMAILKPSANPTDPWKIQTISGLDASGAKHFSHGLGVGDINGDGRQDVVVADGWYESPANADAKEWKFHPIKFGKPVSHMVVYDFDGDGDADIACASAHQTGIWWLEQLSDGWKVHEIDASYSETHSLCLADINADGLPDLVTGKRWWSHAPKDGSEGPPSFLKWYELGRESGRPVWTPHQIDDSSGVGTQFEVTDVNGDGLLDIVTSNKKGTFYFEQIAPEPAAKQ